MNKLFVASELLFVLILLIFFKATSVPIKLFYFLFAKDFNLEYRFSATLLKINILDVLSYLLLKNHYYA